LAPVGPMESLLRLAEVLEIIFSSCVFTPAEVLSFELVSVRWKVVASSNFVWQRLFSLEWPLLTIPTNTPIKTSFRVYSTFTFSVKDMYGQHFPVPPKMLTPQHTVQDLVNWYCREAGTTTRSEKNLLLYLQVSKSTSASTPSDLSPHN
jgi:hypothetical protein